MALTLEAALVIPLSISLIFSLIPGSVREYRRTKTEATMLQKALRLSTDANSLYAFVPVSGMANNVLMTSPKLMFCVVTAIIDDLTIMGFKKQ
jgi:hypothetical protein